MAQDWTSIPPQTPWQGKGSTIKALNASPTLPLIGITKGWEWLAGNILLSELFGVKSDTFSSPDADANLRNLVLKQARSRWVWSMDTGPSGSLWASEEQEGGLASCTSASRLVLGVKHHNSTWSKSAEWRVNISPLIPTEIQWQDQVRRQSETKTSQAHRRHAVVTYLKRELHLGTLPWPAEPTELNPRMSVTPGRWLAQREAQL